MIRKISRFYKGLFWGFYKGQIKMWSPTPEFAAAGILTALLYFFIFNLTILYEIVIGTKIIPKGLPAFVFGIVTLSGLALNYYCLVPRGKFKQTAAEFEKEPEMVIRKWVLVSYLSFGLMFILFLVLLFITKAKH
ncbi:MAG: hypothetical protein ABSD46_13005 [Bacteroidota bacterium]